MQRWIAVAVVALMLASGGGLFAWWNIHQHGLYPVWVPLALNRDLSGERQKAIVEDLSKRLSDKKVLLQISRDLHLPERMKLASDEEAAGEVKKRLIVRLGETATAMGRTAAVEVGVNGTLGEKAVTGEIARRLAKEVGKIAQANRQATEGF